MPTSKLSAIWANDGGDKVTQDELRATNGKVVTNVVWDGTTVLLSAAQNEVVGFNLILESKLGVPSVGVSFTKLGPITSSGTDPFNWVGRPIELFLMKYLQIKGVSRLSYDVYDERQVPKRMQRPWTGQGIATGLWTDRPDHDKLYPDIAVPIETQSNWGIAAGQNQSVWVDVYVPKGTPAGTYTGTMWLSESGSLTRMVPVSLKVLGFALPDVPAAKTMVYMGGDIKMRYLNVAWPNCKDANDLAEVALRDKHFQMAHRHKLSIIDGNVDGCASPGDRPIDSWLPRLTGSLFTAAKGYDGPGVATGNGVFSIGTYGSWGWKSGVTQVSMQLHANAWESWFKANAPATERFLYLEDEPASTRYATLEQWAGWAKPLKTLVTAPMDHFASMPSVDLSTSWIPQAPTTWQAIADARHTAGEGYYFYNGKRPATGSFATEDDGVSPREIPWAQWKKKVDRWLYWESTYYNDYQGGRGQTNVFQTAQTFGAAPAMNSVLGIVSSTSTNGDGLLFYPGIDKMYPSASLGIQGPIASLRMKLWRRGIQDVDYIALAYAKDPTATTAIVNRMVPKALWEYGVSDPTDPTWVRADISWSTNPDDWELARAQLAAIILK